MDEKEGETQLFPRAKKEINDFVQRVEEHVYPDEWNAKKWQKQITRNLICEF